MGNSDLIQNIISVNKQIGKSALPINGRQYAISLNALYDI